MKDPSLPVRVVAGVALSFLIRTKSVQPMLSPILADVLDGPANV